MVEQRDWPERAAAALRAGNPAEADLLYKAWSEAAPTDPAWALGWGGMRLMQRRFSEAAELSRTAIRLDPGSVRACMQLAICCRALRDPEQELAALRMALSIDPYDLLALLAKGDCLGRLDRQQEALQANRAALAVAQHNDSEALGVDVQRMLQRAQAMVLKHSETLADALDKLVAERAEAVRGGRLDRFVHAVEIMLGRRRRFDSQPMGLYYPQLPAVEFFPRNRFPWLPALEAQTATIRDEFLRVLGEDSGFEPYIQYGTDQPLAQWAELNRNSRWSAFHLIKEGQRVASNAERCPATMAAIAPLPQPHQHVRTPVALFSCLKPQTRIPPHVGVSNVRLLVHLPLIVPPDCGFRVGAQTRQWKCGEALVFDDTIEHEAWNLSDALRAVLIFDIWHPDLEEEERQLISALARTQEAVMQQGLQA